MALGRETVVCHPLGTIKFFRKFLFCDLILFVAVFVFTIDFLAVLESNVVSPFVNFQALKGTSISISGQFFCKNGPKWPKFFYGSKSVFGEKNTNSHCVLTSFLILSCFFASVQQFSHCNSDSIILLTPVLIWLNARRQFDLSYRIDRSFKRSPFTPHSTHNSSSSAKRSPNRVLYRSTTTCRFSTDFALGSLAAASMK